MSKAKINTLGVITAFTAGCAYGIGGTISQIVKAQGFALNHIVTMQFIAATVILGVLVAFKYRPRMGIMDAFKLMAIGAMSVASSLFYYYAIDLMTVGSAVAIQFQYVWIAVLLVSVAERKRPSIWVVLSALLIIFGSLLASGVADEVIGGGLSLDPLGLVCAFACAATYGLFIFLNGRVVVDQPPVTRTFFMVLAGLVMASVISPDFYTGACDVVALIPGGIAMGLVMSVVPCICLAVAAIRIPGGLVAILTSVELPMAVLSGALMLSEQVTLLVVIGVIIILAAIVLSELPSMMGKEMEDASCEGAVS